MSKNTLKPIPAELTNIKSETKWAKLLTIKLKNSSDREKFNFRPGQFVQLSLPGFGEAPFSICSNPAKKERFEILTQRVGSLTNKLFGLKLNAQLGIRGPFGNGFPLDKIGDKNISLISGGCGLAPMRSVILEVVNNEDKYGELKIFYGSKKESTFYFSSDFGSWKKRAQLNLIVEEKTDSWSSPTGYVSDLLENQSFGFRDTIMICGPHPMLAPTIDKLREKGVRDKNIYLSLEKNMSCGVGVCQHCNIGTKYVCKDGPVFSLEEILLEDPNFF